MARLEDQIPGYNEALAKERSLRDAAFTGAPCTICGIEFPALTLQKLAILFQIRSPFFCGGERTPGDISLFLWIASHRYCQDPAAREAYFSEIAAVGGDWEREINEYLDYCFLDAPAVGRGSRHTASDTSFVAGFVDTFGSEYGWLDEKTITRSLPRLYQYLKEIGSRKNPERPKFHPLADKLMGDWLRAKNAADAAAKEGA
jgi:hypothetical protein